MDSTTIAVLAVVFVSAFVRGLTGFGNALVAMPLLSLFIHPRTATPVVGLGAIFMAVIMLGRSWRDADLRSAARLLLAAVCGTPFGLFFLKGANESAVQAVLAVVIGGFSLYSLVRPRPVRLAGEHWSWVAGFIAGILGGAYNTNGPPVVVYGTLRGWDATRFKATLQGFFLPIGLVIVTGHAVTGLWTREVLYYTAWSIPVIAVALSISYAVSPRIPRAHFGKMVHGCLIAVSAVLLYRAVAG